MKAGQCLVVLFSSILWLTGFAVEDEPVREHTGPASPQPSQTDDSLARYGQEFRGKIAQSYEDSKEWWPEPNRPKPGTPNVLMVMLDDVGFAHIGSYGGVIETPNIDALARDGLRYNNFHTTALCSPSRASVLAGRNHHRIGLGGHATTAMGFPGYNATPPASAKSIAKHLQQAGFVNYALGKWDHTPIQEVSPIGPFDRWPSGEGFQRYYGFMAADADNYRTPLYADHTPVEDWPGKQNYHLSKALADKAIEFMTSHVSVSRDIPFFLYWAPVAMHAPHQVPKEYIDRYKGKFDGGWDRTRETIYKRQLATGVIPKGTKLSPRIDELPAWDSLPAEEKKLYAHQMEVFAGMLTHADEQVGRMIDTLKRTGLYDNTLVIVTSDNGASGEGGLAGSHNESRLIEGFQTPVAENEARYDAWGGPDTYPHLHAGWAMAGNTPFKYFKQTVHAGGTQDPLIIHWPKGIKSKGEIRTQYHHIIDLAPTILEATGVPFQQELEGIKQMPMDGVSMVYSFDNASASSTRSEQYYELWGNRAIYKDGWKAVTLHGHRMPWFLAKSAPMEDDTWELYNVQRDYSESVNLAAKYPEKLAELKARWTELAWQNNVFPLYDHIAERIAKQQFRLYGAQTVYTYYAPGAVRIPEKVAAPVKGRSHSIETTLNLSGKEEGVIVACGGFTGGYTLYIKDGRLVYEYNSFNERFFTLQSPPLPTGTVDIKLNFIQTGKREGIGELYVRGEKVAQTEMSNLHISTFSLSETFDVGMDSGPPVSKNYGPTARFPFTGTLDKVTVTLH